MSSKRSAGLVEYSSSEEDDAAEPAAPPPKRKKLPALPNSLTVPKPKDDPSKHQGRLRSMPHVDGQWAAHVYVNIKLNRRSALYVLLSDALRLARERVPILQDFWSSNEAGTPNTVPELHISVSRPIFIRAHQREDLKNAVKGLAKECKPFDVSFSGFAELTNDERTRVFLAVEVGAGHNSLARLATGLRPVLQQLRQKEYYDAPRFHASFGWALLLGASGAETIDGLPFDLVSILAAQFQQKLVAKQHTFEVDSVSVKIGKETTKWPLLGSG
ncbi:hypothetical protein CYLTODRAFT_421902 [Cylindrobasidium torrendii FP15055 ss-10]|uniref:U6 snRNA phosphodiesterase n=1 Tax=Cylindrobasidium torrendii FP15055 ss-10 TaxID=1314674 RepID=A0A0D7BEU3_9AGAR|nr:hypothetical protein CYLTODRAFT_421902 [Cylindrobasidium torrendii FP15055 ss-10]